MKIRLVFWNEFDVGRSTGMNLTWDVVNTTNTLQGNIKRKE
jgi:hypothetical protein